MQKFWRIIMVLGLLTIAACEAQPMQANSEEEKSSVIQEKTRQKDISENSTSAKKGAKAAALAVFDEKPMVFMWQVQHSAPDGDFQYLADQGVTSVMAFRLTTWSDEVIQKYLDGAQSAGLLVFVYLGIDREGDDENCHFSSRSIEIFNQYKAHPAVFAWHIVDEPAEHKVSKECQRALHQFVKERDPETPVMLSANNNTSAKYEKYFAEDAFDILEMHKYVNPRPESRQTNLLELFKSSRTRDYPVIITLRAFNYDKTGKLKDMVPGSLQEQYKFFIEDAGITPHYGFYGWDLGPAEGFKQLPELKREFEKFMAERRAAGD